MQWLLSSSAQDNKTLLVTNRICADTAEIINVMQLLVLVRVTLLRFNLCQQSHQVGNAASGKRPRKALFDWHAPHTLWQFRSVGKELFHAGPETAILRSEIH